jgi:hypothetical protein
MDQALREYYLQLARDNPHMLCCEVPVEILAETAYDDSDPTEFLRDFLAVGFNQWLAQKHGESINLPERMLRDVLTVLWDRACRLYTSHLLARPDPDWEKPFFSNEGLEGGW